MARGKKSAKMEQYEVEAILQMQISDEVECDGEDFKRKEAHFLMGKRDGYWIKNYSEEDNTWEPLSSFGNDNEIVNEFLANLKKEASRRSGSATLRRSTRNSGRFVESVNAQAKSETKKQYSLRKRELKKEYKDSESDGEEYLVRPSKSRTSSRRSCRHSEEIRAKSSSQILSTTVSRRSSPTISPPLSALQIPITPIRSQKSPIKFPLPTISRNETLPNITPSETTSQISPSRTMCVSIEAMGEEENLPDGRPNLIISAKTRARKRSAPPKWNKNLRVCKVEPRELSPENSPKRVLSRNFGRGIIKIVSSRSNLTKDVEVEDTGVKLVFPHADFMAPVYEQNDPEHFSNEDIESINYDIDIQFSGLFNRLKSLKNSATLNLIIVDTLLSGLNEMALPDSFIIRAEFPFMPNWLINVLSKKKKLLNAITLSIDTIFYFLGYDMLWKYKSDTTKFVVNLMIRAINDFIDTVLVPDDEEEEKRVKTFVLITIPEIGILRDTIRVFNQGIHKELPWLRHAYYNKVKIELLDWENLVTIDIHAMNRSSANTFDDRLKLLFNEIRNGFE